MKLEKLDTNNKKLKLAFILGVIITASAFILINFLTSRAKYEKTESIKVVSGTINYKIADLNVVAMYKNDGDGNVETATMPGKGYAIDQSQSYCYTTDKNKHDTTVKLSNDSEGNLVIGGLKKGSKCILYFVKDPIQDIITSAKTTVPDFSKTACDNGTNSETHTGSTNCESTDKGVYKTTDADGTSYYYRGTVNNNWVKFAGFWWGIIRINGNGSIRLIYSGDTTSGTLPTDTSSSGSDNGRWVPKTNSQLTSTSAYNSSYKDNTYVGYYYGVTGVDNYTSTHTNATPSTIATYLNDWYTTSKLSNYSHYLDGTTGWCNDRTPYQYNNIASSQPDTENYGYGTTATYYGAYFRRNFSHQPTHTCSTNDLFTLTNSGKENGKLTVPVGLITADELMFAGGRGTSNYGYWLYTGNTYWTMSPYYFNGKYAYVFCVSTNGYLNNNTVDVTNGVRPVINLKAGTTLVNNGNGEKGTIDNPYEVL